MPDSILNAQTTTIFNGPNRGPLAGKPVKNKVLNAILYRHTYDEGNGPLNIMSIYPSNLYLDSAYDTNIFLIVKSDIDSLDFREENPFNYIFKRPQEAAGAYASQSFSELNTPIFLGSVADDLPKGTLELSYMLEITATLKNGNTITWRDDPKITLNPGMKI